MCNVDLDDAAARFTNTWQAREATTCLTRKRSTPVLSQRQRGYLYALQAGALPIALTK